MATSPRAPRSRIKAVSDEPKVGAMTAAVRETLEKLELRPEDAALRALAEEYARALDRAAAIAAKAAALPPDPDIMEELDRLRKRVSQQVAVADIGPKLLAALGELQATPKARASAGKPAPGGRTSRLHALRSEAGA